MAVLDKYAALAQQYAGLEAAGANPFNVPFERVLSPPPPSSAGARRCCSAPIIISA
ncbi:hypothetical protein GT370_16865 [Acidocella sp. MX-AZ03]|uniref:hypothetical protein n=1 Tax=Acidocella sp. MX-AZ03 TaxID=2697363 RepID=UPI0022DD4C61|nr:hypothetical protein [Acidocella sp. MX-AZ03]WBO58777.1 hypothetical protein GT370_16865 [Acidocella sp. MX-AZ03]